MEILTSRFETCTPNQEAINISLLAQLCTIFLGDASPIDDPRFVRRRRAHLFCQPFSDGGVDLLRLLRRCDFAGANGPHRLVCDDDLGPVLGLLLDRGQLVCHHFDCLLCLPLVERLAAAEDDIQASAEGGGRLAGNEGITLAQNHSALRMPRQGPSNLGISQLFGTDLASKSAIGFVENILRADLDFGLQVFSDEEKEKPWWGYNDFGSWIQRRLVEVMDDVCDALDGAIPGDSVSSI